MTSNKTLVNLAKESVRRLYFCSTAENHKAAVDAIHALASAPFAQRAKPDAWLWKYVGHDPYPASANPNGVVARGINEMDPENPPYPDTWQPLAPLYAHHSADTARLEWLQFHGAHVAWGNDGEICSVRWSDRDGSYTTELFSDWREAIDAAMAGKFKEMS
jgi:hypothetical protein